MNIQIEMIVLLGFLLMMTLLYLKRGFMAFVLTGGLLLWLGEIFAIYSMNTFFVLAGIFVFISIFFGIPILRSLVISPFLMKMVASFLPRLGKTERIALNAGTVWWDGDLFSGNPDWKKLLNYPKPSFTDEEQAFLSGPLTDLCKKIR